MSNGFYGQQTEDGKENSLRKLSIREWMKPIRRSMIPCLWVFPQMGQTPSSTGSSGSVIFGISGGVFDRIASQKKTAFPPQRVCGLILRSSFSPFFLKAFT